MSTVVEPSTLSAQSERLRGRLAQSPLAAHVEVSDLDMTVLEVAPENWLALARFLRDDRGCLYDL